MKNKFVTLLASVGMCALLGAQTWIWYPGDYEIWLGNQMNNRRTERGAFFPPFWKTDSHYVVVEFSKEVDLPEAETENGKSAFCPSFLLKVVTGVSPCRRCMFPCIPQMCVVSAPDKIRMKDRWSKYTILFLMIWRLMI